MQLMLMMLAASGTSIGKGHAADAHDAGCFGHIGGKGMQLMLMMMAASRARLGKGHAAMLMLLAASGTCGERACS